MSKPDGGPAFPGTNGPAFQAGLKRLMEAALAHDEAQVVAAFQIVTEAVREGMTLRDYFAGLALEGLLADGQLGAVQRKYWGTTPQSTDNATLIRVVTESAYALADGMIAARGQ